mmetsp:Transcript_47270/g.88040  ORF Transcript_47270/g.88040 Transcript_47270/m.88040 type:complete len:176 (+) Transcript_47270:151-678(+)
MSIRIYLTSKSLSPLHINGTIRKQLSSKAAYIHPLSDAALTELKLLSPAWFNDSDVVMDAKQGTFCVSFVHGESPPEEGQLRTYFDPETRHHFLTVKFAGLYGRVSLMDGSKSAWQSNIGDDFTRVHSSVQELCARIDDAAQGILPGDTQAAPPILKPEPKPMFPFPDNVKPPEG